MKKRRGLVLVTTLTAVAVSVAAPGLASAAATARQEISAAERAKPSLAHGAELFRDCAACHGQNGEGTDDGDVPRIAGQHFRVLVKQLVDYRHEKRWDVRMEHYAGRRLLEDAQSIADVAAHVARLGSEMPRNVGDGALVEQGTGIYRQRCAKCHGPVGQGDARKAVPRLAGQHYEYLLRQMHDAVDGRRPNMSRSHVKLLAKLDHDDLVGVADFLSRSWWTAPAQTVAHRLARTSGRN